MEIHELNTFSGTLGAGDFFATDNGNDTSKVSADSMLAPLNARIDNIIAGGDAPSEAEVTDARLGATVLGGVQYASLGEAIRGQATALFNDIAELGDTNCVDVLNNAPRLDRLHNGIQYTWIDNAHCSVSGTASAQSVDPIYNNTSVFPSWLEPGATYKVKFSGTNVALVIYYYKNGTYNSSAVVRRDQDLTIPTNMTGLVIRLQVENGKTVNTTVTVRMLTAYTNEELSEMYDDMASAIVPVILDNNTDLNDLVTNSAYIVPGSYTIANRPSTYTSLLETMATNAGYVVQRFTSVVGEQRQYIRRYANGSWNDWLMISGGSDNTYNYEINNYESSVTVNASPTIETDAEFYLKEAADITTDRTAEILALLQTNGYCKLGKGTFVVSGLVMPDNTKLEGSGFGTILKLPDSVADGFVVSVRNYDLLANLAISGGVTSYKSNSTVGTRHGIIFQGSLDSGGNPVNVPRNSSINNVYVTNFSGAGLLCQYTGTASIASLTVNDLWVSDCSAGIDIFRRSEYSHFTNCKILSNYYGLINNGGNNFFVNCDFSRNVLGVLMDNTDGEAYNNTHGSMVGCSINHNDSNDGNAIVIKGMTNGFVFEGCNIFFGKIVIEDSQGIEFANMNIGSMYYVDITDSACVLFIGCMFNAAPTFNITNSIGVHVEQCYVRSSGALIEIS